MHHLAVQSLKLACRFPRPIRRRVSTIVGTIGWMVARRPRQNVLANIRQVLGLSTNEGLSARLRAQLIARRIFCNCVDNYLELFALPRLSRTEILARVDVKGLEYFEQAVALDRGAIIVSAHLGPFEYLPSWMPTRGFEMTIPVEKIGEKHFLGMMLEARQSNGVTFVPLTGLAAVRSMLRTLKNRQMVLITADRAIEGASVVQSFFGAPARLPCGPVDLSVMTGAPLIGGFGWRDGGRDVIEFVPISLALPDNRRKDRDALQNLLVQRLEQIIGDHLDEWVVFERIWAGQPSPMLSGTEGQEKITRKVQGFGSAT